MPPRHLLTVLTIAVVALLSACGSSTGLEKTGAAMDRMMHVNHDHPMDHIVTVFRFVEYGKSEPELEYVGAPELDEPNAAEYPRRVEGPMAVDCSRYSDFGILLRRTKLYHRANQHRVDFRVVDADGNTVDLKAYVRQKRAGSYRVRDVDSVLTMGRYIKGLARFIGPHKDGVYRVQATHLDDVLGEAEFELTNCESRP